MSSEIIDKADEQLKTAFIFMPNSLPKDYVGLIDGFVKVTEETAAFYITNDVISDAPDNCIGYCSENSADPYALQNGIKKWIHVNNRNGKVNVYGFDNPVKNKVVICYDYEVFKSSDLSTFKLQDYNDHFQTLIESIQNESTICDKRPSFSLNIVLNFMKFILVFVNLFLVIFSKVKKVSDYSATAKLLQKNALTIKWVYLELKYQQKMSMSVGNAIVSKTVDFLLGLIFLYFIVQYEEEFIELVQNVTENIIHGLEQLLNFLMGSPVGLKLNYYFNKTLGTFFLYHISLWRAFLHATRPLLILGLHLVIFPGAFGLSYQAALLSDLMAFSTFHVYCIYVYAARLYAVQIKSLISLWRLFIGRKYNPLRERVDSHQYTHHQLFIGTLAFTILLFLLPTTFLYYAVFTVFRVALIGLDGILARLCYMLQCLPLYVGTLWAINSFSVRGAIKLAADKPKCSKVCNGIHATLQTLPFWKCVTGTMPEGFMNELPSISWGLLFTSMATGLLL